MSHASRCNIEGVEADQATGDGRCFVIDTSDFPVVRMIFPRVITHEEIDRNFENMLEVAAREPIVVIADARPMDVKVVTPKLRKHFFDKVNEFSALRGHNMLGEAALVSNWVEQHFYRAYLWMKSERTYPTKAFRSELEALDWCQRRVAESRADQAG